MEDSIDADVIDHPPIVPADAVISPAVETKKLDADISPPSNLMIGTLFVPPVACKSSSFEFPNDIEASGLDNVNPDAEIFKSVTSISMSDPASVKASFTNER